MKEEFVNNNDVDEVVEPIPADEEMEEIDMRNNSCAYFDLHKDSVYFISSHPKLPLIASGGGDEKAYLWTTNNKETKLVQTFEFQESVVAGGFTSNGQFLVMGDMSGTLKIFKFKGKQMVEVATFDEVEEIVKIVMHPKLSMFAVLADDGSVWVYELNAEGASNVSVLRFHTLPTVAIFTDNGDDFKPKIFTASEDGNMRLWDVYTGGADYTIDETKLHGNFPFVSLALSPARMAIVVGSIDGQLFVLKVADGTVLHHIDASTKESKPVQVITDPSKLIGSGDMQSDDEDVSGESIEGLAWSQKRNLIATGNVDGVVTIWDAVSYRPRTHFLLQDSVTQIEFVPDTNYLVVASMDASLTVFDIVSNEKVWECLGHSEGVLGFAVQDGGNRLVTAGDDNVCLVFEKQ